MRQFLILLISLCSSCIIAQNYNQEFIDACQDYDSLKQVKILQKWEKSNPEDPELYASYFNYHFMKSRQEVLELGSEMSTDEALVILDSLEQEQGFISSKIIYLDHDLNKAYEKINQGIEKYPKRLDLRFGKIYALGQTENWQGFTDEIIKTIEFSDIKKGEWLWSNNEAPPGGGDFMLSVIQEYQYQIYNTEDNDLLQYMAQIANAVLKIYPEHVESLSNLSVVHMFNDEFEKALVPLLKAEAIAPDDFVIIGNIANIYFNQGNKKKAIKYYEKLIEFDDVDMTNLANERIAELKK